MGTLNVLNFTAMKESVNIQNERYTTGVFGQVLIGLVPQAGHCFCLSKNVNILALTRHNRETILRKNAFKSRTDSQNCYVCVESTTP